MSTANGSGQAICSAGHSSRKEESVSGSGTRQYVRQDGSAPERDARAGRDASQRCEELRSDSSIGSTYKEVIMQNVDSALIFDGIDDYIELPDSPDFSVATTGQLTVSAWIRPDVLTFPIAQSTGYVHWLGKGEPGQREWVFRMYNAQTTDDPPRPNRVSFYVFNLVGGEGIGSYFQEPVRAGEWIHV